MHTYIRWTWKPLRDKAEDLNLIGVCRHQVAFSTERRAGAFELRNISRVRFHPYWSLPSLNILDRQSQRALDLGFLALSGLGFDLKFHKILTWDEIEGWRWTNAVWSVRTDLWTSRRFEQLRSSSRTWWRLDIRPRGLTKVSTSDKKRVRVKGKITDYYTGGEPS